MSVTDSGPAIDSTVQPYLFDPPDATASRRRGAGLGLAIVHGVITQSGGRIDVESPVHNNAGSRFVVLVPAVEDDEPQPVEPDGTSRGTETILVAADDPNLQALIVAVLRRRGYGVLDAHDAWQAVRLAGNHDDRIDLLITTTTTNGRVIADAFRGARAESRVLLIGVAAAESPSAGGEEQFAKDAVLAQPFTPDALGRKVRGLLTAARVHLEMRILP